MEQKQLDELDESFFSEEFIDDEPLDVTKTVSSAVKEKGDKKDIKKNKVLKTNKQVAESIKDDNQFEVDFDSLEEEKEEIKIKPARVKETVKSKEVHITKSSAKAPIETSSPVNPWANEEKKEPNFFEEGSTWKVITGVLVVLLIFSIITGGFQFSMASSMKTGSELTLTQAQEKTLTYVNSNLLRPPFVAEVKNISEINDIYKVSLAVADHNFDTYLTKDGKYLFLEGFDTGTSLKDSSKVTGKETTTNLNPSSSTKSNTVDTSAVKPTGTSTSTVPTSSKIAVNTPSSPPKTPTTESNTISPKVITVTPATSTTTSTTATGAKKELTLTAKKWFFNPSKLNIEKGDKIVLTIVPDNLDFTFSIPDLNVEKEVKGKTIVEFTASQSGSFDYSCSSCEDYRGMSGTLIVQ